MSYRRWLLLHFWRKFLGQTTYSSLPGGKHLPGGTGRMTMSPGKDEDVRRKLIPSCSSSWFETTFPSKCWPWIPCEASTPWGAEDRHCKALHCGFLYGSRNLKARLCTETLSSPAPKSVGAPRLMSLRCVSWRTPQVGVNTRWVEHTETYITAAGATRGLKGFLSPLGPSSLTFFVSTVFSFLKNMRILTFNAPWFAYN